MFAIIVHNKVNVQGYIFFLNIQVKNLVYPRISTYKEDMFME